MRIHRTNFLDSATLHNDLPGRSVADVHPLSVVSPKAHNTLTNRDAADCHPLAAITGLALHHTRHEAGGADIVYIPPQDMVHNDMTNRDAADCHPVASITGAGLPLASKVKVETRDNTAASGDVAYTGYGFKPRCLIIVAMLAGTASQSIGYCDVDKAVSCVYCRTNVLGYYNSAKVIYLDFAANYYQTAIVKTLDNDGFTLTWTKTGLPGGTSTFIVLALK